MFQLWHSKDSLNVKKKRLNSRKTRKVIAVLTTIRCDCNTQAFFPVETFYFNFRYSSV